MNMKNWFADVLAAEQKKPLPVLSFPCIQKQGITVKDLINDSDLQSRGMKIIADSCDTAASVSLMDLSVEAECFGAPISFSDDEVPTCVGPILDVDDDEDERLEAAKAIKVPEIGTGRTQIYLDSMEKAMALITDRPVFGGTIGPFSLAGRLMDVTSSMIYCMEEPEMVHVVLEKCTEFITKYILAYKKIGANGVVIAEPLAGLLGENMAQEFSGDYCKKIVDAVQDDNFAVILHNCGNTAVRTLDSIVSCGAMGYHFGDAINMKDIMEKAPSNVICMGNVSPAKQFRGGTPESVREATLKVMEDCCKYKNFVISSGCDIPPMSSWDNINSFFKAVNEFYGK